MNARIDNGTRILVLLTLAAMMTLGAGTALAQGPGNGGGRRGPGNDQFGPGGFGPADGLQMMTERLDLTPEQVAAIEEIQTQGREKNGELRKEMMRLENELQGEMLKDDPSEKTVQDLNGRIGALRTELQGNRLENRMKVREQLTPQQRDKMLMMRGMSHKGGGHRGGGRGPGSCRGSGCDGHRRGPRDGRGNW